MFSYDSISVYANNIKQFTKNKYHLILHFLSDVMFLICLQINFFINDIVKCPPTQSSMINNH